jgi:hypothetical protein
MTEQQLKEKARILLAEINKALEQGTQHFRVSDNKLLRTPKEIVKTLLNEGMVEIVPANERN